MITRRATLGLALTASALSAAGIGTAKSLLSNRTQLGAIDALLVDSEVAIQLPLTDLLSFVRHRYPAVALGLDPAGLQKLNHLFGSSQTIIGLSSGAALFCVEQMAADYGFRLTARGQQGTAEPALLPEVADLVRGFVPAASGVISCVRNYRASRSDNQLHAWVLQKSAPSLRLPAREIL